MRANLGNFEHAAGQNLSVGDDDNHVRLQRANLLNRLSIFDSRRLQDEHLRLICYLFDWRRFDALLPPNGFVRLGDDCNDFVLGLLQHLQCRCGDFARADKDDAHAELRHQLLSARRATPALSSHCLRH
jgi:hypothetical protein